MFRPLLIRQGASVSAAALLVLLLQPLMVAAQTMPNSCSFANKQCTAAAVHAAAICGPCTVSGYIISGKCTAVSVCTQFGTVRAPDGTSLALSQAPQDVQAAFNGTQGGILSGVGSFIKDNPLIGGLALGAGMSLITTGLSALISGSGSSNNGGSSPYTYNTGGCTTQYYYTSDQNALVDPCAIYSPTVSTSTNVNSTDLSSLLNSLNSSNTLPSVTPSNPQNTISDYLNNVASDTAGYGTGGDVSSYQTPISDILNSTVYYDNTTGSNTPDASSTPLNNGAPAPANGLTGNITTLGGGVTIYASNRTDTSQTSGFFGLNGAATQLCQSRPWASNFLSYVIPATFFDSLCNWAGYSTTSQQTPASPTAGSSGQSGSQTISVGAPQATTTYENTAQASATIWARPSVVSIGGRTNIFWISQNVTACTESSSDGNFSGSTTSGGASTVALSGPVTFTIECRGLDGAPVSNSTTVTIGS
jgi:hypothetical protein